MSCTGCRVLRKGCSETCPLRACLSWIDGQESQGHATVFLAKFFGRSGLMAFINAVPESHRAALFQSLLYEACGRTVYPVYGCVGLLLSGRWPMLQAAVEKVLQGGSLEEAPEVPCMALPGALSPAVFPPWTAPPGVGVVNPMGYPTDLASMPAQQHPSPLVTSPTSSEVLNSSGPPMTSLPPSSYTVMQMPQQLAAGTGVPPQQRVTQHPEHHQSLLSQQQQAWAAAPVVEKVEVPTPTPQQAQARKRSPLASSLRPVRIAPSPSPRPQGPTAQLNTSSALVTPTPRRLSGSPTVGYQPSSPSYGWPGVAMPLLEPSMVLAVPSPPATAIPQVTLVQEDTGWSNTVAKEELSRFL